MNTRNSLRIVLTVMMMYFVQVQGFAQTEKYLAAFTYQFTKYITWPGSPSVFVIAIVGNSNVTPFLQQLSKEKKVGSSTISIVEWGTPGEIGTCNILFVCDNQTSNISAILAKLSGKPVLVITESPGNIRNGIGISFLKKDGKIMFELNKTSLSKSGLIVSGELERMATKVY